jgi:hypothetical protein
MALAVTGTFGLVALCAGWGVYSARRTGRVPFTTVGSVDGVELREYPAGTVVETTAPTEAAATARLKRYLTGANEPPPSNQPTRASDGPTTAVLDTRPVAPIRTGGIAVDRTVPSRLTMRSDRVTVGVFLTEDYTVETAPVPTNPLVSLRPASPRTLAVRAFSWRATDDRTRAVAAALVRTLDDYDLVAATDPVLFRYDSPLTPPFLRRYEVAVELRGS